MLMGGGGEVALEEVVEAALVTAVGATAELVLITLATAGTFVLLLLLDIVANEEEEEEEVDVVLIEAVEVEVDDLLLFLSTIGPSRLPRTTCSNPNTVNNLNYKKKLLYKK
jgi:hypothetical protein